MGSVGSAERARANRRYDLLLLGHLATAHPNRAVAIVAGAKQQPFRARGHLEGELAANEALRRPGKRLEGRRNVAISRAVADLRFQDAAALVVVQSVSPDLEGGGYLLPRERSDRDDLTDLD